MLWYRFCNKNYSDNSKNLCYEKAESFICSGCYVSIICLFCKDIRSITKEHATGNYVEQTFFKLNKTARKTLVNAVVTLTVKSNVKLTKTVFWKSFKLNREEFMWRQGNMV